MKINERAPGALKKGGGADLANVEGARGFGSQASDNNNLFNKHFNKELKLCEGKSLFLINF